MASRSVQPEQAKEFIFIAPQTVFDVIGELTNRRLRFRTCWMAPEDYPKDSKDDLLFERYPYVEFPMTELDIHAFAAKIREQATNFS